MSWRYAIGITETAAHNGQSEAERYHMFRNIEFDTEEFHALVAAFTDFLKRKKITDIVRLKEKYREADLIWLSRNYAMGRHSYAADHCNDIISYADEVLSDMRKEFMAEDIRRELPSCHKKCRIVFKGQESIIPYINSWRRAYNTDGLIKYERVKVPIDKPLGFFRRAFLVEDYIVEDYK